MNDEQLVEYLADGIVRIEINYLRETSGPGSRLRVNDSRLFKSAGWSKNFVKRGVSRDQTIYPCNL